MLAGFTEFEYEINRDRDNLPVGGLRVKGIKSFTGSSQLATQKNYSYTSLWPREIIPSPEYYINEKRGYYSYGVFSRRINLSENPDVSFSPKGSPIGYDMVTETENNGSSTTYQFDNDPAYTYERLDYPAEEYITSPPTQHYFKTFTSKQLISAIEDNQGESNHANENRPFFSYRQHLPPSLFVIHSGL